jgi:hypothetical protein
MAKQRLVLLNLSLQNSQINLLAERNPAHLAVVAGQDCPPDMSNLTTPSSLSLLIARICRRSAPEVFCRQR